MQTLLDAIDGSEAIDGKRDNKDEMTPEEKVAIKREKSQTGLNSPEREQARPKVKEWFLSVRLYNFDYPKLVTFSPLDCPEVIEVIDALKKASLAMVHDIRHSDAKQPKLLMNELFGV